MLLGTLVIWSPEVCSPGVIFQGKGFLGALTIFQVLRFVRLLVSGPVLFSVFQGPFLFKLCFLFRARCPFVCFCLCLFFRVCSSQGHFLHWSILWDELRLRFRLGLSGNLRLRLRLRLASGLGRHGEAKRGEAKGHASIDGAEMAPVEGHGSPWTLVEVHGSPWKSMEAHGSPWKPMAACGSPWKSMGACGSPWMSMELHGRLWKSVEAHGSPWTPVEVHGSPWALVERLWKPMEVHGSPWTLVEVHGSLLEVFEKSSRSIREVF